MTDLNKFCCLICKYSTKTNANLKKHFTSKKHESNSNPPVVEVPTNFHCKTCNKYYRSKPGLWKHVKLCKSAIHNTIISENESNLTFGRQSRVIDERNFRTTRRNLFISCRRTAQRNEVAKCGWDFVWCEFSSNDQPCDIIEKI